VKSAVSSVLGAGSQILGAGSKALANGKRRKNKTIIKKAKKVIVLNKGKKKAAKPKRNPIRERLLPTGTRVRFKDGYEHGGMTGVITSVIPVYLKEKHWTYRIQLDGISGGKGQVLAQERLFSVINPKRKRNLDHKDSTHQVEVSKHWRAGGLSQWQRAHHAGQHDLFSHGIKAKPKRNPSEWYELIEKMGPAQRTLKKSKSITTLEKERAKLSAARQERTWIEDSKGNVVAGYRGHAGWRPNPKGKRNATTAKSTNRSARAPRAGASSVSRKTTKRKMAKPRKPVARRNPSAPEIRKTFAGRYNKDERLIFPDGTPTGLAKLGQLVSIKTDSGKFAPVKGVAWLCADTRGKLHIGTPTKGHVVLNGPRANYGHVHEIEYKESKPHLGYAKKTLFFHKLGEENGIKPQLIADGKGGLKFVGGAYKIKREGIVN